MYVFCGVRAGTDDCDSEPAEPSDILLALPPPLPHARPIPRIASSVTHSLVKLCAALATIRISKSITAFLCDITEKLGELNRRLQGEHKLISQMANKVFAFEDKLNMHIEEIKNENLHNFPTLIKAQQDGIKVSPESLEHRSYEKEIHQELPNESSGNLLVDLGQKDLIMKRQSIQIKTIWSCLSKVIEKVVCLPFATYLEAQGILMQVQTDFRKNRSTAAALIDVCNKILEIQDYGTGTILVLLHFVRAFDTTSTALVLNMNRNLLKQLTGRAHAYGMLNGPLLLLLIG
ncbi:hypothetical protein EVAR_20057_1 [Eumeta japonica]|uniref:Reverse transcriptase domain-containing protein n=1 Tax=Eumeta variegata TaxID=151549 RepID=A0A4C1UHT1_EUMVA|nr:hypothetical protein EVAR_20057_1 [Eumeta japonica]